MVEESVYVEWWLSVLEKWVEANCSTLKPQKGVYGKQ